MTSPHFLIVGLDGLRADMMTPELTPHLWHMAAQGSWLQRHHAAFPTATRVNVSSLVTGANSGQHGVVNNSIYEPGVVAGQPVDMGKYHLVEAADAFYQGQLFSTPSLGEMLATRGDLLVAVSAGTTGSNRLMHHKIKTLGGIGFSTQSLEACYPRQEAAAIVNTFGPVPPAALPDQARLTYITDVWLNYLWPTYQPRVSIVWFSDPDKTSHYRGIGAAETLASIGAADAEVGRILQWLQQSPEGERLNLLVLSDHGHITVRQQLSVCDALTAAGIPAGHGCFGAGDVAVVPGATGSIHVRHHEPHLIRTIGEWLQEQPWCGALFTAPKNAVAGVLPGTFARSLVFNEHPRSGDIVYTMRSDDQRDARGIIGGGYDDSALPIGGGTHGGLSRYELHNVAVAYGPAFRCGHASVVPSGTIDIMPTLLHLLGYELPSTIEGRVLHEALVSQTMPEETAQSYQYDTEAPIAGGVYRQHVATSRVAATTYIDAAWVTE